jgi:hypothetical protein
MNFDFPLPTTTLEICQGTLHSILSPVLVKPHIQANDDEILLDIFGVVKIQVTNGQHIRLYPSPGADADSIRLFLNGSALGALLHQRGILPFHGNSFMLDGKGMLLCGHSGAGKSSVSAAFCQNGATFINDDISPVIFQDDAAWIIPLKSDIKLWDDSLVKLGIQQNELKRIRPQINKYFLPTSNPSTCKVLLNHLLILSVHTEKSFIMKELVGIEKFETLRHAIYRKVYLNGMPNARKQIFGKLMALAANIRTTRIIRPESAGIYDTMDYIRNVIDI